MSTFISYSRADSAFAVKLAKDLKSAGHDVWLDQLDIPTGARWDDEVENALESCTTFMILLSEDSIQSQNVKDEVGYAIDVGKEILPVRIEACDIPLRLRRFQYVDFSNKAYERSLKEIKGLLSAEGGLPATREVDDKLFEVEEESAPTLRRVTRALGQAAQPGTVRGAGLIPRSSRGTVLGVAIVAVLATGGILISRAVMNRPADVTTPTAAPAISASPLEQPTTKPTLESRLTAAPVSPQASQANSFTTKFTEGASMNDWEHFVRGTGNHNQINRSTASDGWIHRLGDANLSAFYIYEPVTYQDVVIRVKIENLGANNNNISLLCRRTGDKWYEFSINSGGEWYFYQYNVDYLTIGSGATTATKTGQNTNEYEMHCIGKEISLRVNGQAVQTIAVPHNTYTEGQVGLSLSTTKLFPIESKLMEVEISSPGSAAVAAPNTPPPGSESTTGQTWVSGKDGMTMVLVPAGEFTMGSDSGEPNEGPAHTVFLNAFWIDRTEVTNSMFATFLNSQGANSDVVEAWLDVGDKDLRIHFAEAWKVEQGFEDHPVIEVKWFGADAYCRWRGEGTRLPTEAEWEKAARGTTDNIYPWGNEISCSIANFGSCTGATVEVGSYPSNVSPYGALDMAGGVMEWVFDRYVEDYYENSPDSNPPGPEVGQDRVFRGGSWDGHTEYEIRVTHRMHEPSDASKDDGGFRCARPD